MRKTEHFKLQQETVDDLMMLKQAFEKCYGIPFTNDRLIDQMIAAVEDGDPGVWEYYGQLEYFGKILG